MSDEPPILSSDQFERIRETTHEYLYQAENAARLTMESDDGAEDDGPEEMSDGVVSPDELDEHFRHQYGPAWDSGDESTDDPRSEECPVCLGRGTTGTRSIYDVIDRPCRRCGGSGLVGSRNW